MTKRVCGKRPSGIYQGKPGPNTLRLVAEEGGFMYNSDSYADDLPYWNTSFGKPLLIIPYTLDNNDMRFSQALEGDRFFNYLKVHIQSSTYPLPIISSFRPPPPLAFPPGRSP